MQRRISELTPFGELCTRRRSEQLDDLERRCLARRVGVYVRMRDVFVAGAVVASVCAPVRAEESASKAPGSDSVAAQPRELARVRYRQGVEAFKETRFRD